MATQFLCAGENRREMVRGRSGFNGIDYLEVVDSPQMDDVELRQRRLLLFLLNPLAPQAAPLTKENIRIESGRPPRLIPILGVRDVTATSIASEWGTSPPSQGVVFSIELERPGDFSTYRLRLVDRGNPYDPPESFDPLLSEIEFSFKVACPTELDCRPLPVEPGEFQPQPPIDYLAKDYASFRRLMLDRMAVVMPEWEEKSPADLGIALVEALAYGADHLSYYQDAVATEAYLGTARKRVSVRRHARLLDYHMHDGCNARVWVCLEVDGEAEGRILPAKTPLLTSLAGAGPTISPSLRGAGEIPRLISSPLEIAPDPVLIEEPPQQDWREEEEKEEKSEPKEHHHGKGRKKGHKGHNGEENREHEESSGAEAEEPEESGSAGEAAQGSESEPETVAPEAAAQESTGGGGQPEQAAPETTGGEATAWGGGGGSPGGSGGGGVGAGVIGEDEWESLIEESTVVFETIDEVVLHQQHNVIPFYTWGNEQCLLPQGATGASLKGDLKELRAGDVLMLEEIASPITGQEADADPARRHAVRLTAVRAPELDPLTGITATEVEWHAEDALPFPLRISALVEQAGGKQALKDISIARGNMVPADHGRSIRGEEPIPAQVPGEGRYRAHLSRTGITQSSSMGHDRVRIRSAAGMVSQDPRSALPQVSLRESDGGEEWNPQRDLLNSGRFAREFVLEPEEDGRGWLRFGNNVLGRKPIPGTHLTATYRVGNGSAGNVGAGAISHVVGNWPGILRVFNPLPAGGGVNPESIEQVRLYAPKAFRTRKRAVTEADYAEITQQHPEVQKAVARLRWTGSWHTVFISVDREGGHPVDQPFELELRDYLEPFRQTGRDLEFSGPRFVPLEITFTVHVAEGHLRNTVKTALTSLFSGGNLPDGRRGLFHPDNFTFGQTVHLSPLISAAMSVVGVEWVDIDPAPPKPNRFRRLGDSSAEALEEGRIIIGQLEIARLDNNPNAPENGVIGFHMEGGL